MDIFIKYLNELDSGKFDHSNQFEIEARFQNIRDILEKEGNHDKAKLAQLEMEVFSFTKTVENYKLKLTYRFAGTGKNDKGENVPVKWPDSDFYGEKDFEYIKTRFENTKNDYAKIEYGLVLLLANKSSYKNDDIALEILNSFIRLSNLYLNIIAGDKNDSKHHSLFLENILQIGFILANIRKGNSQINSKLQEIESLIFKIIINWNPRNSYPRIIAELVELIVRFRKSFERFDMDKIQAKLWETSNTLLSTDLHGAVFMATKGLNFSKNVMNNGKYDWLSFIASSYEKLADEAESRNDHAHIEFIEEALKFYKKSEDEVKIKELEKRFYYARSKWGLSTIKTPISEELKKASNERVQSFLSNASEIDVISTLATTPMIPTFTQVNDETNRMYTQTPLIAMITKSVLDKTGNTIAVYNYKDKEDIFHFNLVSNYNFYFQFALDEINQIVVQSIKKKILTLEGIEKFFKDSWLAIDIDKHYLKNIKIINLADVILPQIKTVFDEISARIKDDKYEMKIVQIIDSLTLKFEYTFRFLCEKLEIPTYREIFENKKIKEERSLNSLLEDTVLNQIFLSAALEDDLFFYKFVFTDKAGLNLRNRIAHGLMDSDEYDYSQLLILIISFLKISTYKFQNQNSSHNGDNSEKI